MAVRTYIPGIVVVARYLQRYLAKHSTVLKEKMGAGLYSLLVFVVDLVEILAAIIGSNSDANGDFQSALETLTSGEVNSVRGAYQRFLDTNGVEG